MRLDRIALTLGFLVLSTATSAFADDTTYHGPPYGPGTAIPHKPDMGSGSGTTTVIAPGVSVMGPVIQFRNSDRDTIGDYFRTYFLCPRLWLHRGLYTLSGRRLHCERRVCTLSRPAG